MGTEAPAPQGQLGAVNWTSNLCNATKTIHITCVIKTIIYIHVHVGAWVADCIYYMYVHVHVPETGLVDADVHPCCVCDLKGKQVVLAAGTGVQCSLHPGGVPARAILTHVNLTEITREGTRATSWCHLPS